MARALKTKQPRSSVDRFLEKAQISGALAQMDFEEEISAPPLSQLESYVAEAATVEARIQQQPETSRAIPRETPKEIKEAPLVPTPHMRPNISLAPQGNSPAITPASLAVELRHQPEQPPKFKLVSANLQSARPGNATGLQNLRPRDFVLGRQHEDVLRQLREIISRENGVDLSHSHLMRALLVALADVMPAVRRELSRVGQLKRPANGSQHEAEREQLETTLKNVILSAMRG